MLWSVRIGPVVTYGGNRMAKKISIVKVGLSCAKAVDVRLQSKSILIRLAETSKPNLIATHAPKPSPFITSKTVVHSRCLR